MSHIILRVFLLDLTHEKDGLHIIIPIKLAIFIMNDNDGQCAKFFYFYFWVYYFGYFKHVFIIRCEFLMSKKQCSNIYRCYNWTICMINDECLFILRLLLREFVEKISDSITYLGI
jgi:hypothetical protein